MIAGSAFSDPPFPLAPGEKVLWCGRPIPGLFLPVRDPKHLLGLAGMGFGLGVLAVAGGPPLPQATLIAVICAGMAVVLPVMAVSLWANLRMLGTSYWLTDRRAVIHRRLFAPSVMVHAITGKTRVNVEPGRLFSITFAEPVPGRPAQAHSSQTRFPGFDRLTSAWAVHERVQEIQAGKYGAV